MEIEIHHLDVGRGDCSLLIFRENDTIVRTVLIDCGGTDAFGNKTDVSAGIRLVNYLRSLKIKHIHVCIITHWDNDHFGGINYILDQIRTSPKVAALFDGTVFYGRGEAFKVNHADKALIPKNFANAKSPYIQFRTRMTTFMQTYEDTEYPSELVKGWGQPGTFKLRYYQGKNRLEPIETFISVQVSNHLYTFAEPDEFLGEDLLNLGFDTELPARLRLIVVNNHFLNGNDQVRTVNLGQSAEKDENNFSQGLLLTLGEFSFWFGGDLEADTEDKLIPKIKKLTGGLRLTAMKASHHGSAKSTSETFLEKLQPGHVFISSPPNSTKHPSPEVIHRLQESEYVKKVFLTGCVSREFKLDGLYNYYSGYSDTRKFYIAGADDNSYKEHGNIRMNVSFDQDNHKSPRLSIRYFEPCVWFSYLDPKNKKKRVRERSGKFLSGKGKLIIKGAEMDDDGTISIKKREREPEGDWIEQQIVVKKRRLT